VDGERSQREALERMAHLFCETMLRSEAARLGENGTCPMPVTQANLSEMTAMSTVHVNRTLQTLRGQNLISFGKGSLTPPQLGHASWRCDFRSTTSTSPQPWRLTLLQGDGRRRARDPRSDQGCLSLRESQLCAEADDRRSWRPARP
jgi:hypothetical protein